MITRAFEVRADTDTDLREVSGIAVPWDTDANVGPYTERFQRGSVEPVENVIVLWGHDRAEVIGRITRSEDTERGFEITATISRTPRGDEVMTLVRDGVIKSFSIGFRPVAERDDDGVTVRERVTLHEVSLVPFPAYESAEVLAVRGASIPTGETTMTDSVTSADITEVRSAIEDLDRKFETFSVSTRSEEPAVDRRSAGAIVKAIVDGDESTINEYNRAQEHRYDELQQRAYDGTVLADAPVRAEYITNLTRIYDASSGVQSRIFSRGTLPATGNTVEFVRLKSNTLKVDQQLNEGDTLAYGKLQFESASAPVKTFGGYTDLSRQAIERSSIPVLNTTLEALAIEAGKRKKIELRAAVTSALAARRGVTSNGGVVTLGATLAASVAGNWEDALIDAAIKYDGLNANPEALVVSASVFKKLRALTVSGERVFTVADKNASGSLNLPGLTGNLAGIPVYLDAGQAGDEAYFVNGRAIKQYDSALFSLSDENITNLTKQFSVYFYGAIADEFPELLVPVKFGA
jgi:HK97 family phage prohead protease